MESWQAAGREARRSASLALAASGHDWEPSRFFDAWKDRVDAVKGGLVLQYMHYCRGMPPDVKKRAVDYILRGTMPCAYESADRKEALDAMDNDIGAMREYAERFLGTFWNEYWAEFLAEHPHDID